ncbi:hypothetical protein OH768_00425 [Streptomyces sp. NBC_01622]|uniref:hypothetical protein n=1 Tax=Streptomyces sp. NBC_01622 TaxID=2975903 RepID=UPI003868CD64|nr:hypothetical protein OH768_00425 [Streptomyces sp. NBC_01622]
MGDLGIALIAAGSALAGSGLTGLFTILAGRRQAAAAQYAGDKQAQAVLVTVQQTLDEQRVARLQDARRNVYAAFVASAEQEANKTSQGVFAQTSGNVMEVDIALSLIKLEGPPNVYDKARQARFVLGVENFTMASFEAKLHEFIDAAQEVLNG